MKNIIMPKLSDTMTEGLLGSWLKSVGDTISRGEIIAEVETDKATMGLEAFDSGILLEQRVRSGETVAVGTVLGVIGSQGELPAAADSEPAAVSREEGEVAPVVVSESGTQPMAEAPRPTAVVAAAAGAEKASPVVRRRARELGIDLESCRGSGSGGRVLLADLARCVTNRAAPQPVLTEPDSQATGQPAGEGQPQPVNLMPLSRMREAIARTVSASWKDIPHFYVTMEIEMENAEEVRRELQVAGTAISVNDIVLKAVAVALLKYPGLNAAFIDGRQALQKEINIGFMVNVDDGLIVPVIRECGARTLTAIADRSRQLINLARSGRISQEDLNGGTFSVSNLGPFGVSQFSAIILPPQVAILAVGAVCESVIPRGGAAVITRTMKVTLGADHRAVDGAYAAGFLQEFKSALENPVRLLL